MFDYTFLEIEKAMSNLVKNQEVHAHNLANINTPGYEPVEFDEELQKAVKRLDNKKVVLEEEMAALSENSIKYTACVKLLTQKVNVLKTIASQGRR